ncbi:S8 family peptidase [Pseudonocardia xishanensis]|uniref:S8 family serine peptidase n=1 Tax=Pseudonocardia xishanensis TaxID=630995 RepID=A0ABP8RXZ5_9PSEU
MHGARWRRVIGAGVVTGALLLLGVTPAEALPAAPVGNLFVELDDTAAVDDWQATLPLGRDPARQIIQRTRARIDARVDDLVGRLRGAEGQRELYRTHNAVPGVAVRADAATAALLARSPGVRSVRRIPDARPGNASAAQLAGSLKAWQDIGRLGTGVRIGIVDTGIDYTHADFGGPGTVAAFRRPPAFPTAKVVGGIDLAGDDYDSASPDPARTVPQPDADPLDCEGHGTHVAGTAAGFGVNADGSTFTGDYSALTPEALDAMRIGPGAAPRAELYAIRVFGCDGATALTPLALDRALDPNGDGDLSDRLDVVNLSLGSDFAPADDPVNDFATRLVDAGVSVVAAAGNGGDVTDAAGAPATAPGVIAVANVRDPGVLLDGADVVAPSPARVSGLYSVDFRGVPDVTAPVVAVGGEGCAPFDGVRGAIAWLEWPASGRACGSATRADNAAAAGAVGVLLASAEDPGDTRIAGNATVPMFQLDAASTAALRPSPGSLRVHLDGTLAGTAARRVPEIADTISASSARGTRGPGVKPDVGAPGETIVSAAVGTGTGRISESGTSMASPFVAGVAALVREAHPDWTPAQVKTAIVTTAVDVHAEPLGAGDDAASTTRALMAPMRVGSGRVDARAALDPPVLAGDADLPGAVGVGFGVVEVPAGETVTRTRTVEVGGAAGLRYEPITTMPGVAITVSPTTLTGPGRVTVTLTARGDALRRTLDPTMSPTQEGRPRQYVADASGRIVLTAAGREVRVPVTSAAKPVSTLTATRDGDSVLLAGRGVDQGTGSEAYRSRAGVFRLLGASPALPACAPGLAVGCVTGETGRGGDVRWVGATRAGDTLGIALVMWGSLPDVGATTVPSVGFDVDGDGAVDRAVGLVKVPETDVLVARVMDLRGPAPQEVDSLPVNGLDGDTDSNVFDTGTWVLPVRLAALGIDPAAASAPLRMQVLVEGDYGASDVTAPGAEPSAPVDVVDLDPWDPLADDGGWPGPADPGMRLPAPAGSALVVFPQNAVGAQAALLDPPNG